MAAFKPICSNLPKRRTSSDMSKFNLVVALAALAVALALPDTAKEKALAMLSKMTLKEKLAMMHGEHGTYVGNIVGNERLGIPPLNMQDGPQGFRATSTTGDEGTTTAWPSALSIAASWDKDLLYEWASAMGDEFKAKGANVALLPGIGIARVPTAGRNFEYLCGEDPFLGSHLVQPVVVGIQEKNILANAKHFVNNEIETARMRVSANVNERVRFELYYPPFQAAVDVGVLSVMCAYNRINDVYACQNNDTFSHLRESMGFEGFIFSDWTATKSTAKSVKAGLDQELPFGIFYSEAALLWAVEKKEISLADIDTAVGRILTTMYAGGLFENPPSGDPTANVTSDAHNALARKIAATSTVLLKNEGGVLPLSIDSLAAHGSCIAVIGDETTTSGGGSGHVVGPYTITPTQGVLNALAAHGTSSVKVVYNDGTDLDAAAKLAASCEVAVVNVATTSSEGGDRENLSLGNNQDELVAAVAAVNKNTVVSVVTPGAILMPWSASVPAILVSWLPGQEAGNALADVLFGVVNPSARLHVTLPNKENEVGFTQEQFPGVGDLLPEAAYTEELLIGYRWYDANGVAPLYPFGHGLSYTSFQYSDLSVKRDASVLQKSFKVSLTLTNTGARAGADVAQLYLAFPTSTGEPPRQLRGISKSAVLAPGESTTLTFTVSPREMSVWDAAAHAWAVTSGAYSVLVGASSRDIRLVGEFTV